MKKKRIGMRNIKTSIAVLLTLVIYIILLFVDKAAGIDRINWEAPSNMYTPFFAAIAAVYATHRDSKSSFTQAKIRSVGSIIGGYYGMVVILLVESVLLTLFPIDNFIIYKSIEFAIVAIAVIPLIRLTNILKQNTATFITCLTYLSVTISVRNGGMPIAQFATNRVLSTLIGVGCSLLVNNIGLLRKTNKNIIFMSSLDNNLLNKEELISPYLIYKLNNLYYKDMNLCFATTRTTSSLGSIFQNINVNKPMIIMNGSAIYDFSSNTYNHVHDMNKDIRFFIDDNLRKMFNNVFSYTIHDNIMHCYHDHLINEGEIDYYQKRKKGNYYSFVRAKVPSDLNISLFVVVDRKEKIDEFTKMVDESGYSSSVDLITYKYELDDFYYLKINSKEARKENSLEELSCYKKGDKIVVCGSGNTDIPLMDKADFAICLESSPSYVKSHADYVIEGNDPSKILQVFEKFYYCKNFDKQVNKYVLSKQKKAS